MGYLSTFTGRRLAMMVSCVFGGAIVPAYMLPRGDKLIASVFFEQWFVGGHSLGGAMACRYASSQPEQVNGLVLFAAYCEADATPEDPTLSVTGSADTVLDRETYHDRRSNLPANATVVEIEGMNHSVMP